MRLEHGDNVESRCGVCQKNQRVGADTMGVDWVEKASGTRLYVCEEHARDLGRFGVALEDMAETPRADLCTGCGKLTREADMPLPRVCRSCHGESLEEAVVNTVGQESLSFERAVALVEDLMDESEEVPPEAAAEAMEKMTGMPMTPAQETEAGYELVRVDEEAAEDVEEFEQ